MTLPVSAIVSYLTEMAFGKGVIIEVARRLVIWLHPGAGIVDSVHLRVCIGDGGGRPSAKVASGVVVAAVLAAHGQGRRGCAGPPIY